MIVLIIKKGKLLDNKNKFKKIQKQENKQKNENQTKFFKNLIYFRKKENF